jgi:hypothetical protein
MPLVFVHGVNTRINEAYEKDNKTRDALFRQFALQAVKADPARATILNPYWGDLGVRFYWEHASLPGKGTESFANEDDDTAGLLTREALGGQTPSANTALLQVARQSLPKAVDLLWLTSAKTVTDEKGAADLAQLAERTAAYLKANPKPSWLNQVQTDDEFVSELTLQVDTWVQSAPEDLGVEAGLVSFGMEDLWRDVREAGQRIASSFDRVASRAIVEAARPALNEGVSRFLGDAFTYLDKRGTQEAPGPIVQRLVATLAEAQQKTSATDPRLIVVAHSMGGNVMYDILTHFLSHSHPNLMVDAFVTVGSQVGLFEEMKLFRQSDLNFPTNPMVERVAQPANVMHWLNVFDENDLFAFATEGVFDGVTDFSYVTGQGLIGAHIGYFSMPSFHRRLAERLKALFG